jgi:hypothetical protein
MDEAHRLRESSNSRWTAKAARSERTQVEELIDAARVAVFFIDDNQIVRPTEVGSTQLIRESAFAKDIAVTERRLEIQFRCAGCDAYVDWIDQLLEVRKTGVASLSDTADFDFRLASSPEELDSLVRSKAAEGYTARLVAGFCWPWSDPKADGTLASDVRIGAFTRPWNAKHDAKRLAKGIPKAQFWANDPGGVNQIGCIYSAQGFEFDYVGVIMGPDLVIRNGVWAGQPAESRDPIRTRKTGAPFTDCVKNAYRVLLTRGMRGCYLYVMDPETRAFIEQHIGREGR